MYSSQGHWFVGAAAVQSKLELQPGCVLGPWCCKTAEYSLWGRGLNALTIPLSKGVILGCLLNAREELWEVVGIGVGAWPRCSGPGLVWY